jgi:hypothetical protein
MASRLAGMEQTLDLPPGYTLVALREYGDAFAHGCDIAEQAGAGTLVWVRRYDRPLPARTRGELRLA